MGSNLSPRADAAAEASTRRGRADRRLRNVLRAGVLLLLVAAPLAFGSVHPPAYIPLLVVAIAAGLASWARGHYARGQGKDVPRLPGRRLLLGVHLVVLLQLLPLPASFIRTVSPGSYTFHRASSGNPDAPEPARMTLTVSPEYTRRGLAFLFGMTLLYGTVFREFRERRWRRRLAWAVVLTGTTATVVGLVQAGSADPGLIYGIWRPRYDRWVFGPYVNRSHFGGYMAMVIPLAAALTAEAGRRLWLGWPGRWWMALGAPAAHSFLIRLSLTVLVIVGVFVPDSRAGMAAAVIGLVAFAVTAGRRNIRAGVLILVTIGALSAVWLDWERIRTTFLGAGGQPTDASAWRVLGRDRLGLWRDQSRVIPDFPVFGVGLNAMGWAYSSYQTFETYASWPQTHNDYLQALTDLGIVGATLVYALLFLLFRTAWRSSSLSLLSAGVFASLVASAATTLVDFNWQIQANCGTFVSLAGLAMSAGLDLDRGESAS